MDNVNHDPGKLTKMQVDFFKMQSGSLDSGFFIVYVKQDELTHMATTKLRDYQCSSLKPFIK